MHWIIFIFLIPVFSSAKGTDEGDKANSSTIHLISNSPDKPSFFNTFAICATHKPLIQVIGSRPKRLGDSGLMSLPCKMRTSTEVTNLKDMAELIDSVVPSTYKDQSAKVGDRLKRFVKQPIPWLSDDYRGPPPTYFMNVGEVPGSQQRPQPRPIRPQSFITNQQGAGNSNIGNSGFGNLGFNNQGLSNQDFGNQDFNAQRPTSLGLGGQGFTNPGLGNNRPGSQGFDTSALVTQDFNNQGLGTLGVGNQGFTTTGLGNPGRPGSRPFDSSVFGNQGSGSQIFDTSGLSNQRFSNQEIGTFQLGNPGPTQVFNNQGHNTGGILISGLGPTFRPVQDFGTSGLSATSLINSGLGTSGFVTNSQGINSNSGILSLDSLSPGFGSSGITTPGSGITMSSSSIVLGAPRVSSSGISAGGSNQAIGGQEFNTLNPNLFSPSLESRRRIQFSDRTGQTNGFHFVSINDQRFPSQQLQ